jgi:hypothetical protein
MLKLPNRSYESHEEICGSYDLHLELPHSVVLLT